MKVGDRVARKHDDFTFDGVIIGILNASSGREVVAVEQDGTGMVMCFYENQMFVKDGFGWQDIRPTPGLVLAAPTPPPPPKLTLPQDIFVPVRAVPAGGMNKRKFVENVHVNHLPPKLREQLITDRLKANVEFHFVGKRTGDLDNLLKPTLDLLKGSIIRDDSQIMSLHSQFFENSEHDGFRIMLELYDPTPRVQ